MQNAFRVAQNRRDFLRHTVIVAEVNVYQAVTRLYGLARFSLISAAGSQFASPRKEHTRREAGPQSQESRRFFTRSSGCRRKIERSDARSDRRTEFQAARSALAPSGGGHAMLIAENYNEVLIAPPRLDAGSRLDFRRAAR